MNLNELGRRMSELKDWGLEGMDSITKEYHFKDFNESMWFVNKIAEVANKHNHHPSVIIDYNMVRLTLTTHSEKGLSDKDFDVAKDIDEIE